MFAAGRDDVEDARRQPGLFAERGEGERRKRRGRIRFGDDGASRGDCRSDLAGQHGQGEVPWRDGGDHADRFLGDDELASAHRLGDDLAIGALRLLGEPLDVSGGVGDFATAFGHGLALLHRDELRQVLLVLDHEREPALEHGGALFGGAGFPLGEGGGGGFDRRPRLGGSAVGDGGNGRAGRRVSHRQRPPIRSGPALAANQSAVKDQFRTDQVKFDGGRSHLRSSRGHSLCASSSRFQYSQQRQGRPASTGRSRAVDLRRMSFDLEVRLKLSYIAKGRSDFTQSPRWKGRFTEPPKSNQGLQTPQTTRPSRGTLGGDPRGPGNHSRTDCGLLSL